MRVKRSDVEAKKRKPQTPINYPAPDIAKPFHYDSEKQKVENLCKRLADNEVDVRDAVLDQLPVYLREVCTKYEQQQQKRLKTQQKMTTSVGEEETEKGELIVLSTHTENSAPADEDEKVLALLFSKLSLGLFYCYFHSDKPLVQHECASKISKLLHSFSSFQYKVLFVEQFFGVLVKNWSKIDKWRLDKYYSLVRKCIFEIVNMLTKEMIAVVPAVTSTASTRGKNEGGDLNNLFEEKLRLIANHVGSMKQLLVCSSPLPLFTTSKTRDGEEVPSVTKEEEPAGGTKKGGKALKNKSLAVLGKKRPRGGNQAEEQQLQNQRKRKRLEEFQKRIQQEEERQEEKRDADTEGLGPQLSFHFPIPRTQVQENIVSFFRELCGFLQFFQEEVLQGESLGLSMHICDVFLNELLRVFSPSSNSLFVGGKTQKKATKSLLLLFFELLTNHVLFFAMSRGNFIEKRVVDHFFIPVAAGVLEPLDEVLKTEEQEMTEEENEARSVRKKKPVPLPSCCQFLSSHFADLAKRYAVSRNCKYEVRSHFSECELYLAQYVEQTFTSPEAFVPMRKEDYNAKIQQEVNVAAKATAEVGDVIRRRVLNNNKAKFLLKAKKQGSMNTNKSSTPQGKVKKMRSRRHKT